MELSSFFSLFHLDPLAIIMMVLVGFIGITIASFSARYLKGDTRYQAFFIYLGLMICSVMVMVSTDHLLLLLAAWGSSNFLLVKLMIHKSEWKAAGESGFLASRHFLIGSVCIASAFLILAYNTGETSIQTITKSTSLNPMIIGALGLMFVGVMTQSGIWPFHKWLTSSLNSPTPVSAIMHAGLINGGGFLLARFAPLYLQSHDIMTIIFGVGLITAIIGTLWKLMQSDIKRMLACSTMGQMGFMIAQCGMGLFPAAIAHICWHGMFKAYLFLSSGSAAQEKRLDLHYPPSAFTFLMAVICGLIGAFTFAAVSQKNIGDMNTTIILVALALIATTQFAIPFLRDNPIKKLPLAISATIGLGAAYGGSILLIEHLLTPMNFMQPQPINLFHVLGIIFLVSAWLAMLFGHSIVKRGALPKWLQSLYVRALNASQPHPLTITSHRNHYKSI